MVLLNCIHIEQWQKKVKKHYRLQSKVLSNAHIQIRTVREK